MIDKIDLYKESLYIRFNEGGDTFKGVSKLPHYKDWQKILNYLKKRGFEIKVPEYYIRNNWGQASHKIAVKNTVAIFLECMGSEIQIKFGDINNLWDDQNNFWDLTDRRSTQLTYLEAKRVELEVIKLVSLFPKDKVKVETAKLSPEERIIKDKIESSHSRDISKLDELGLDGVVFK